MQTVALNLGALLLLAGGGAAEAQSDLKIGFVNLNAILQNAPQIPGINQQLRSEFSTRDAEFKSLQEDYWSKSAAASACPTSWPRPSGRRSSAS